jgi:hypothetical protein
MDNTTNDTESARQIPRQIPRQLLRHLPAAALPGGASDTPGRR